MVLTRVSVLDRPVSLGWVLTDCARASEQDAPVLGGLDQLEAIIAERQKRRFRRIEDILRVPGIGRKTFGRLRHSIRVR